MLVTPLYKHCEPLAGSGVGREYKTQRVSIIALCFIILGEGPGLIFVFVPDREHNTAGPQQLPPTSQGQRGRKEWNLIICVEANV